MREFAFVVSGFPVEEEGANGAKFGEDGVQDAEVEVVAGVDPDEDEEGEVGAYERVVEVV